MALTASTQAWLISKLGKATDIADLETRYTRLGTARAVAIEVLNERLADLRAQAATVNVSGVVNVSFSENIKAYEREIALLESGEYPAPDDPDPGPVDDDEPDMFGIIHFTGMERR